jgi:superfamily II DNA/RNA helicase
LDFTTFNFQPDLMEGLLSMGFNSPTPIQEQAIPLILNGRDLIACAQTGTGKTAAFLLPIINGIVTHPIGATSTLVIVPTRELAIQIDEALQGFAYFAPVSSLAIFGGSNAMSFEQEKKALTQGVDIIIATPGRLLSHLNLGYVKLDKLRCLVLDEADRMLDMGFNEDISKIINHLPANRQTLFFSATMPPKIRTLANRILKDPAQINIAVSKPAEGVLQGAYVVYDKQKIIVFKSLLQGKHNERAIVFCSRKHKVKELEKELKALKFSVGAIHSDLEQEQRNDVLRKFKSSQLQVIVATDILSRGIDIDNIGLVINYDVPSDAEDYIHRIGRTARAESTGVALTFIGEADQVNFKRIEDFLGYEVKKLPLPVDAGEGPSYNPMKPRTGNNGNSKGKGRKFVKRAPAGK